MRVVVKLAERPGRGNEPDESRPDGQPSVSPTSGGSPLGLTVRDLDRDDIARLQLPTQVRGVLIARVDPIGPAFDADLERGQVILEVNRRPVVSARQFQQLTAAARPGDVLALFLYLPDEDERALRTVRIDQPSR